MKFKVGTKVQWKWLGRPIDGTVKKVFTESITQVIKGKKITRNGSKETPAYLVESKAGNLALKLKTELSVTEKKTKSLRKEPSLFKKDFKS